MEKKTTKSLKTKETVAKAKPKAEAKKPAQKASVRERVKVVKKERAQGAPVGFGLHSIRAPRGAHKKKKLLGRGPSSGHGKTSTRGSKGQTSRAGRDFYLGFEGGQTPIIRRIPKRGFTSRSKKEYQIINLSDLNRIKEPTISLELLEEKGLIKDKSKLVKILGDGELKNPVAIQAHACSKKAYQKILNVGGNVQIVNV